MNKSLISDWHNLSKFQITEDILTKRCEAFEKILVSDEKSYWIDILRLFLDLNADEKNIAHFVNAFQTIDDTFPRLKIEKLTKALAAMALTTKIQESITEIEGSIIVEQNEEDEEEQEKDEENVEEEHSSKGDLANVICGALMNATFLKQIKVETKIPLLQVASDFLSKYALNDRTISLYDHETSTTEIERRMSVELDDLTTEENLSVIRAVKAILKSNAIQKEELNILWWIFGEYSEIGANYFRNIDKKAMSIIAAKELHNLSLFTSQVPATKHLLRKILSLSKTDETGTATFSIKDCIESLDSEIKKRIIGNYGGIIDELTPCVYALQKSEETGGFKNVRVNINEKLDLANLSSQFYKELTFLSAI